MVELSKLLGGIPNARFFVRNDRFGWEVYCATKSICRTETQDTALLIADCLDFAVFMIRSSGEGDVLG